MIGAQVTEAYDDADLVGPGSKARYGHGVKTYAGGALQPARLPLVW
jgi:hypothetical protein